MRPNPFKLLKLRANPWTSDQIASIKAAFDPTRLRESRSKVETFIQRVGDLYYLHDPSLTPEGAKKVIKKLSQTYDAAKALLTALSRLRQGDGYLRFVNIGGELMNAALVADQRTPSPKAESIERQALSIAAEHAAEIVAPEPVDLALNNQHIMLRRLWTYTSALQLQASYSLRGLTSARDKKGIDQRRDRYACLMFQDWIFIFGERPVTSRREEFAHVVSAIGKALGITIGARTIENARLHPYWSRSIPPPPIHGTPETMVSAGTAYDFRPTSYPPEALQIIGATLAFSIENKPAWAEFAAADGRLSGTPSNSDAGNYSDIAISVTDGNKTSSLAAFSIAVSESAAHTKAEDGLLDRT